MVIAESTRALRVLETSHAPTWYLPPDDVRMDLLEPVAYRTFCEWKGVAHYYDLAVEKRVARVAWAYPDPFSGFESLRAHVAFYPGRVDACFVDDERVVPQAGGFYAGWITSDVVGPFKGEAGTEGW